MKKVISYFFIFMLWCSMPATLCWAYGFTDMSNQELYEFRPSLKFATEAEKQAYWNEWKKREQMMPVQEKEKYPGEQSSDQGIKFLYSPGMGYEGPVSVGEGIYGSATRPVYKPLQERKIYGIHPKEEDQKPEDEKGNDESSQQKEHQAN